jgi:DNA-binding NarL/FixJ family response regulator
MISKTTNTKVNDLISITLSFLNQSNSIDDLLAGLCTIIQENWIDERAIAVKIVFREQTYTSPDFALSGLIFQQNFDSINQEKGNIQIFSKKPKVKESTLNEMQMLFKHISFLVSNALSALISQNIVYEHSERLKELQCINKTSETLKNSATIDDALSNICSYLPPAFQYPEYTAARILYEHRIFESYNFQRTQWSITQSIEVNRVEKGKIEVFYLREFPKDFEGPFLKEERNLLINLSGLIEGALSSFNYRNLLYQNTERLKELQGINHTTSIIQENHSVEETLQRIATFLPEAWQYPKLTVCRITFDGREYTSDNFAVSPWNQTKSFITIDNRVGNIEVFYNQEMPTEYEGPFLQEERNLIDNIATLIAGYLNNIRGRDMLSSLLSRAVGLQNTRTYSEVLERKYTPLPSLQEFFDKQAIDKYIYLDMMRYKIKEILFVATLYDAFTLENEDNFFAQFMGEIYQYALYSLPRITGVSSEEEALEIIQKHHFDIVILMQGHDQYMHADVSRKIKEVNPNMPVYLVVNKAETDEEEMRTRFPYIDKLFFWSGNSKIFFAVVKSIEDNVNADNDTKVGLVRVILLVEDSPIYFSRYLTYLYSIVFEQIQNLIAYTANELDKLSKIRSRPKILHARNYEEAVYIFNKYRDYVLCVISDAEFSRQGGYSKTAGIELLKFIKAQDKSIPIVLQSSEPEYANKAVEIGATFLNKHSARLYDELKEIVSYHLAFGDFIFRNEEGEKLGTAKNIHEFLAMHRIVPEESIVYHSQRNQFSLWLMSRGEIKLAKVLNPIQLHHFPSVKDMRNYVSDIIEKDITEKKRGRVIDFDESALDEDLCMVRIGKGSFGGKGRGLAFINTLIANLDFSQFTNEINIKTPRTVIIGSDEFDQFLLTNNLDIVTHYNSSESEIKKSFLDGLLSNRLQKWIHILLDHFDKPLAVRSSSLFEDSLTQPFSGVFDTYIIPNNHPNSQIRFEQLCQAIKLVYASLFFKESKNYFESIHHRIDEEKMSVIVQEVVGNKYEHYYYPNISGTARSYNFYPFAYMKPEEGFASIAIGLGEYVVSGEKSYRFSPMYPQVEISTPKDIYKSSQTQFLAVDLQNDSPDLITGTHASLAKLDIDVAERHKTLRHCASVYDLTNERLIPGIESNGPRVVNFANILKFNYIPLAKTIEGILQTVKIAMDSPVEIEYAIDLEKDHNGRTSFYLLQIKPLTGNQLNYDIDMSNIPDDQVIIYTQNSIGNGQLNDICDIIFIDNDNFDNLKTLEMVSEIEALNQQMIKEQRQYILMGPGRWGTSDQFQGIPIVWAQISNAKVIVEISTSNFPVDTSLGSHFFHNVTAMNVGYLSVSYNTKNDKIVWDKLLSIEPIQTTKYFRHIRYPEPLCIMMDGMKRRAVVFQP